MEDLPFLRDLAIVTVVAVGAMLAMARLRLPVVTGLLLAGAVVGPSALGLVDEPEILRTLSETGVVLLLFTIGLEVTPEILSRVARLVALGGGLQVGLTVAAAVVVALAAGEPAARGVFLGFVLALSSTAVVLQVLAGTGEVDSPHGRVVLGVLLFQDLAFVPMALLVPALAGGERGLSAAGILWTLAKAVGVVGGAVLASRAVLPRLLARVDATRSREAFLVAVLAACVGTAWLTSLAGLSLALGAFLAGLVLAGTDYAHRALGDVLPLRSVLTSLFFVSLGMLFDPRVVVDHPVAVGLLLLALVPGKALLAALAALLLREPVRVAVTASLGLAQFGEFGFVLAGLGGAAGLVTAEESGVLLAAGVLSLFLAPPIIRLAPRVGALPVLAALDRALPGRPEAVREARAAPGHVVIVGFGVAGRVLARALREAGIPYRVLELNAATVRSARAAGEPASYADATNPEALHRADVEGARAVAVLINDYAAVRRVVSAVHRHAPRTPVLARARYLADRKPLLSLGATEVVSEEVEAGMEMLARVLEGLGLPPDQVGVHVHAAREATQSGRSVPAPRPAPGREADGVPGP